MTATSLVQSKPRPIKRLISLDNFLEKYVNKEDSFKYEWNKGIVEKTDRTMNRNQFAIYRKLLNLFCKTTLFAQEGILMSEVDMYLPSVDRTRRADIAVLRGRQVDDSVSGEATVCPFVIEIISKNDQINEVEEKILEYFENGVEVIWIIFPKIKKVEVYTSIEDVKICFGNTICSAMPVLPDFNISVNDIFG